MESRATDETCMFGRVDFSTIHDVMSFVAQYKVPTCDVLGHDGGNAGLHAIERRDGKGTGGAPAFNG